MRSLLGKSVALVIVPLFLSIPLPQKPEAPKNDLILFAVWGPQQGNPPRAFVLDPIARIKGATFTDPLPEGKDREVSSDNFEKIYFVPGRTYSLLFGGVNLVPLPSRRRRRSGAKARRRPQRRQNQLHLGLMHWQSPLWREFGLTTIGAMPPPTSKDRRLSGWRAIT